MVFTVTAPMAMCSSKTRDSGNLRAATGICRDRRDRLAWILAANAGLVVLACVLYFLIVATHRTMCSEKSWKVWLIVPLVGFAVGRVVPYAIAPTVGAIQITPELSAATTIWFPLLMGLGVIGGPLIAYWLASQWLAKLWSFLNLDVRGGALFAAVGAGTAAYLARPLLLYVPQSAMAVDILLMTATVILLAYLLGRSLDRSDSSSANFAPAFLLLAAPAGMTVLHADVKWLAVSSVSLAIIAVAAVGWDVLCQPPPEGRRSAAQWPGPFAKRRPGGHPGTCAPRRMPGFSVVFDV